jgi:Flp pilus assembly protein TadG
MRRPVKVLDERGSVTLEFALCLLLLIPVFLGTWAFGYTFFQYAQ